jgi:DNA-binding response OmpR family regulator
VDLWDNNNFYCEKNIMADSLKLLLVDDDDAFRLALESAMIDSGYIVESCDCGEAAINLLRSSPYDVVVLDYRMPGISGLNVLQWMNEQKMETPVIMLTAAGSENIAVEAMKFGAYDYFAKDTIDIFHLPIAINSAHERFLFKKEKKRNQINEQTRERNLKAAELFRTTLSSLSYIVNNSLSLLLLNIQEDVQTLLPNVKEKAQPQFMQVFNEIAQDMNVISVSVRAMLNLSEAMCNQIEVSEDTKNLEKFLKEEIDVINNAHAGVTKEE